MRAPKQAVSRQAGCRIAQRLFDSFIHDSCACACRACGCRERNRVEDNLPPHIFFPFFLPKKTKVEPAAWQKERNKETQLFPHSRFQHALLFHQHTQRERDNPKQKHVAPHTRRRLGDRSNSPCHCTGYEATKHSNYRHRPPFFVLIMWQHKKATSCSITQRSMD